MVAFMMYLYIIRRYVESGLSGIHELNSRKRRTNPSIASWLITPTTEQLKFILTYTTPFHLLSIILIPLFHHHCYLLLRLDSLMIFSPFRCHLKKIILTCFPLSCCPCETSILSVTRRCCYYYKGYYRKDERTLSGTVAPCVTKKCYTVPDAL